MIKVSDKVFWKSLRKMAGNFALTVRVLEEEHGVKITRQAVRKRALNNIEKYNEIIEENKDVAESIIQTAMRSNALDLKEKTNIAFRWLEKQGKDRGYGKEDNIIQITPKFKFVND